MAKNVSSDFRIRQERKWSEGSDIMLLTINLNLKNNGFVRFLRKNVYLCNV